MKRSLLLVAALAFLASAAPAQAALLVSHRAAIVAARFDVPLPPGDATVLRGVPCPDSLVDACTVLDRGGIIYLPPDPGRRLDAFVLAHELAHLFDDRVLTDVDRARMMRLLGVPGLDWYASGRTGSDCGPRDCPAELFADAYAGCALDLSPAGDSWARYFRVHGGRGVELTTSYGHAPTRRHQATLCQAIRYLTL